MILLSGGWLMVLAVSAAKREDRAGVRRHLLLTLLVGSGFAISKVLEYKAKIGAGIVTQTGEANTPLLRSLLLIEVDRRGFRHGRNRDKLGHLSADTSELFFDDVRVTVTNILGVEGHALAMLMSELRQEQLTIALQSMSAAQKGSTSRWPMCVSGQRLVRRRAN